MIGSAVHLPRKIALNEFASLANQETSCQTGWKISSGLQCELQCITSAPLTAARFSIPFIENLTYQRFKNIVFRVHIIITLLRCQTTKRIVLEKIYLSCQCTHVEVAASCIYIRCMPDRDL